MNNFVTPARPAYRRQAQAGYNKLAASKKTMKYYIILSVFLFSCSSLKQVISNDKQQSLTKENISKINAEFEIFSSDESNEVTLDLALAFKKYWWRDFNDKKAYRLILKAIDEHHLEVSIFKNDLLLATKTCKFKYKDGKLIIKKRKISPFYFIFNGWGSMTSRLTLLENGNLSVDHDNFQVATLVIIPLTGDRASGYGLEFRRRIASR
jgi:hypothetical protein